MTSSQMGARRTFEKVQDRGSLYPVTLDGYIKQLVAEEATCHFGTECFSAESMKDKGNMMLYLRGSDYRRSQGSTWHDRMDNLLMTLGFTESKAYSNVCFKVEGGRPVMLLLCVDALRSRHVGVDKGSMQYKY